MNLLPAGFFHDHLLDQGGGNDGPNRAPVIDVTVIAGGDVGGVYLVVESPLPYSPAVNFRLTPGGARKLAELLSAAAEVAK